MALIADITVFDRWEQICALVEVKGRPETDAEWAIEVRGIVLEEYGFVPRYFLVVARDRSYLWASASPKDAPPDEIHNTDAILRPYLEDIHKDAQSVAPSTLELTVGFWLQDLIATRAEPVATEWALPSGFAAAITDGHIKFLRAA